ncbi:MULTISPECIES: DUF1538 family protein [Micrococcales]|uniref:DUF1538 domain-containing protein n=1 Tax=Nesterenkonia salmonea TaxID=1804987 RepID=A0A5R9B772_9MICC|nr:DUF1538 family protein [Nesterenkonia salmonea]TLP92751.1 DUF1538 domain-containing protein [Nesterenkonia salmonea]
MALAPHPDGRLRGCYRPDRHLSARSRQLAFDSGGVTTNIVTVPLIAAIGIGLAASIGGRSLLRDGFGLVALCVTVP